MAVKIKPYTQETMAYCGPAMVQTLLDFLGVKVKQTEVVAAARAKSRVMQKGVKPEQLVRAVRRLVPGMEGWLKQNATVDDMDQVINRYGYPVGVNWQGLFYNSVAEEKKLAVVGNDPGHYSCVIGIDQRDNEIVVQDPYPDFAKQPRKFALRWFVSRWWDMLEEKDNQTGKSKKLYTRHLMMIVAPGEELFPEKLKFKRVEDFGYLPK